VITIEKTYQVVKASEPEIAWVTICEANSWDEFQQKLQEVDGYVPAGRRVKFVITATIPIAPLFDLMGAEFLAGFAYDLSKVGAELVDVYGDGYYKIVVMMRSIYLPPAQAQVFPALGAGAVLLISALAGALIARFAPILADWLTSKFGLYAEEWVSHGGAIDLSSLMGLMVVMMMMAMIMPMVTGEAK
jgi:hypothetical protein